MEPASQKPLVGFQRILEPRKGLISLVLGFAGFAGAFFSLKFSAPPLTLSILWSYALPLLAALAYGGRFGLIAGLLGGGALYPFFLWKTNGWANVVTALLILGWFFWHGYNAQRRLKQPTVWNHPLTTQLLLSIVYATTTRLGYPLALAANPPAWAPEALTTLDTSVLNGVVTKGTLNLYLAFFAAAAALITPEVRRLLHLPVTPASRENGKIMLATLACALLLWGILLLA
ncbi:MAG: hypothetical protein RBT75_17430, partial [Anaerolineae bacterium]|nr:hypothetical protein [Anaerolineae bacterium]